MSDLLEFTNAYNWDVTVFIDPGEVCVVAAHHKDRDMGSYTRLIMRNGTTVDVTGSVVDVAKRIREGKAKGNEE